MTTVLSAGMRPTMLDALEPQLPADIDMVVVPDDLPEQERAAMATRADIFFGSLAGVSQELLEAMAGYRLVQLTSAGYEALCLETIERLRIPVATNGGANAVSVAEHTIMLMLACLRYLGAHHLLVKHGQWRSLHVEEPTELEGKTVGLLGFGHIGRTVAQRLKGWGVVTLYHDVTRPDERTETALNARFAEIEELLATSDILSVHTPLNASTKNLLGVEQFSKMKPGAVVINTSRGEIIDEDALCTSLRNGHLGAAGLDVFRHEPCQASPLFELDSVVLTPHTAGNTVDVWRKTAANGLANIRRVIEGKEPMHLIPEVRKLLSREEDACLGS